MSSIKTFLMIMYYTVYKLFYDARGITHVALLIVVAGLSNTAIAWKTLKCNLKKTCTKHIVQYTYYTCLYLQSKYHQKIILTDYKLRTL